MGMNTAFLVIFVGLQIADIWTTLTALKQGGLELNPFLAKLFERFDPLSVMVPVKLAGVWALWYVNLWGLTALMCMAYMWVIFHNLDQIFGKK
jgi:hypothetical protein